MVLQILGSSSNGNSYILEAENSALIIEAGFSLQSVLERLDYDRKKIVGCLVSHEHGDHAHYIRQYLNAGVKTIMPPTMQETFKSSSSAFATTELQTRRLGDFTITPLSMVHDVECNGYTIYHPEMGTTLFVTDTEYIPHDLSEFKFNHIMIETNYSEKIIRSKMQNDATLIPHLRHIMKGHLSVECAVSYLTRLDLTECNDITLLHMSESNSNERNFVNKVKTSFPLVHRVWAGKQNLIVEFNKTLF